MAVGINFLRSCQKQTTYRNLIGGTWSFGVDKRLELLIDTVLPRGQSG